jgi:hypothetical protein
MRTMKVFTGAALAALLALSLIGSAGSVALSARGHIEGVTWETGTVARGPQTPAQGNTWESGVTWE